MTGRGGQTPLQRGSLVWPPPAKVSVPGSACWVCWPHIEVGMVRCIENVDVGCRVVVVVLAAMVYLALIVPCLDSVDFFNAEEAGLVLMAQLLCRGQVPAPPDCWPLPRDEWDPRGRRRALSCAALRSQAGLIAPRNSGPAVVGVRRMALHPLSDAVLVLHAVVN